MCLNSKQRPHADYIRIHPIASNWYDFGCCTFCPQLSVASHIVYRVRRNREFKQYPCCTICAKGWAEIAEASLTDVV